MFACTTCDAQFSKWEGRCSSCGAWGTIAEDVSFVAPKKKGAAMSAAARPADVTMFADAATAPDVPKISTGIAEVDRVLGGGVVPGSVTLLAGEPGVGKSTLVAQWCAAGTGVAYYVSGEESEQQVRSRLLRLGLPLTRIAFSHAAHVGEILAACGKLSPALLIVDSIQTIAPDEVEATPGSPAAVRAATAQLVEYAKRSGTPVLLIGQVTKDGAVAGPKTLEHLVDTVVTLEGDPSSAYRLLRAVKHRFGATDEVGVFTMTAKGLEAVANPSARFLEARRPVSGSAVACIMEGNRPFLLEIQALVDKTPFANPIRRTSGVDQARLLLLLAILSKRAGLRLADHDVYVNVVGGVTVDEPAADLAIAAAVISAAANTPCPMDTVWVGELGLGGEVRSVPHGERRAKEAMRLGFARVMTHHEVADVAALRSAITPPSSRPE